jgi:hypothetical protein
MQFHSEFEIVGGVKLPTFRGTRILMMPLHLDDIFFSLPSNLRQWTPIIKAMKSNNEGTAYLTIDERYVRRGLRHRRPGLHVDGWNDKVLDSGVWGGGNYGSRGWATVASHTGCAVWNQSFEGEPKQWGDCSHLQEQCDPLRETRLRPSTIYRMGRLAVHETLPMHQSGYRQFVRLSMPSKGGWPISCTPNPRGIKPDAEIIGPRPTEFTRYVPS